MLAARARPPEHSICYQAFDLFDTLPLEGDSHEAPPARPPPGWKERFTARQKVAACLSPHAGLAPKVRPETKKASQRVGMQSVHPLPSLTGRGLEQGLGYFTALAIFNGWVYGSGLTALRCMQCVLAR